MSNVETCKQDSTCDESNTNLENVQLQNKYNSGDSTNREMCSNKNGFWMIRIWEDFGQLDGTKWKITIIQIS